MIELAESTVAILDQVLTTSELASRPARAPEHASENRAIVDLATVMAESPHRVFQRLANGVLDLCRAGSAGISVLDTEGEVDVFRWRATAGDYARYVGGTMPRDFSPCGAVLDRKTTLLMSDPARYYPYISELCAPVHEVLLVPFYHSGQVVGTVWAVSHSPEKHFDAEDARLVTSLSSFAGAALQTLARIEASVRADESRNDIQLRLEATLTAGEVATWTWDVKEDKVVADRNLARLFGVSEADARGGPIARYTAAIHPDDREPTEALIRLSIETGEAYEARYRVLHADGEYHSVIARGRPIYDADRTVSRLPGVVLDISRQVQVERQLRASEERRRLALDSAELGAWHVDPDTMSLTTDARFRAIFGVTSNELDYATAVALIHPDDQARVQDAVAASIRTINPVPYEAEYRIILPDKQTRWVFAKGRANVERYGTQLGLVSFDGTLADITERKRAENALRQLAADLSEAGLRKDEFLATLAHELRNPLAPIRNGLTVLLMGHTDADQKKTVGMMERQVKQLVHLVDDLLDVSRVTTGKVTLRPERVLVQAIIEGSIETNRPLMDKDHHTLSVNLPAHPIFVDADPTRFSQIITNLLNNATKYTPAGGKIEVSVVKEKGEAVIRVTDNGVGIPTELLPKVFDMFMQVGASLNQSQGGLGLGLTLVRKLTEMHGGTVSAESDGEGMGSTFTVRLPLAVTPVAENGSQLKMVETRIPIPSMRILVVDDNRDGANSLAEMLLLLGNEVHTAHDGLEAVAQAERIVPDVILMDVGMPKLNGLEATDRIRRYEWGQGIAIIALTGWGQDMDRERSREAGCDGHLVKPVDLTELGKLLNKLKARNRAT